MVIPAHGATGGGARVPFQLRDPPLADGLGLRELGEVALDVARTEIRREGRSMVSAWRLTSGKAKNIPAFCPDIPGANRPRHSIGRIVRALRLLIIYLNWL